jgi:hypothetical protein
LFLYWCSNLIAIDLSRLSNVTYIGNGFLSGCSNLTTIDLSHLSNVTYIGNGFLSGCINLTTIDLSGLSNVTLVGNSFLSWCSKLETINLSGFSNVTQIDNSFLSWCSKLETINLPSLSNVTKIGNDFLSACSNLETIDLSRLSNVEYIGNDFLSWCSKLTTINLSGLSQSHVTRIGYHFLYRSKSLKNIISNEIIKSKIEGFGFDIKNKFNYTFSTYEKDIDKINSDEQYTKELLKFLNIHYADETCHNNLIKIIEEEKDKYNDKLTEEEIEEKCINKDELFTMEELKNIPKSKLILLSEIKGKYYCFDTIALKQFIFEKQNNTYKNPYTNTEFSQEDINKILKVDIRKIRYFF